MRLAPSLMCWMLLVGTASGQDGTPQFHDRTVVSRVDFLHKIGSGFTFDEYTGGGAVGDFDRDGWQDVFAVSGGGFNSSDQLFMNQGDGTFRNRANAWAIATPHVGKGATCGDFNGDGRLDLYVTSAGPVGSVGPGHHKLYRNEGSTFTDVAPSAGVNATHPNTSDGFGAAFGDYDLDGDLDLVVAGFNGNDSSNKLFRNDGDETFTDVTVAIDLWGGTPVALSGFAPRFADMDGDRHPELLMAADFGTTRYLRNDGDGTFTDVTTPGGLGQEENGMGQTVGDFDNDGRFDWYTTSIYAPSFGWTGNKLYWNLGGHSYGDASPITNAQDGGYAWGAVAIDFDHDGLLDIACTNGAQWSGEFIGEPTYLWMNDGGLSFTESATSMGLVHTGQGRALLNLDYDNDGDQDLLILSNEENSSFWENELAGNEIAWLRVFLDTTGNDGLAPDGFGAVVVATVGGASQRRGIWGGDGFLGSSELSAHFGLGAASTVDELRVEWPDGEVTVLTDVAVNQTLTIQAARPARDPTLRLVDGQVGGPLPGP